MDIEKIFTGTKRFLKAHDSEILTGIGIGGMGLSIYKAVTATPKAMAILEKEENRRHRELKPMEMVKTCYKPYIPSAVLFVTSSACLIGATVQNKRKAAALAAIYQLSENTFANYRQRVKDEYGDEIESRFYDRVKKVDKEQTQDEPSSVQVYNQCDIYTYVDEISPNSRFQSTPNKIENARLSMNKRMLDNDQVALNDWYEAIGMSFSSIGEDIGWDINKTGYIEIEQVPEMDTTTMKPYIKIIYRTSPISFR